MVDTTAGATLHTEPKKLHPFFTEPRTAQHDAKPSSSTATASEPADTSAVAEQQDQDSGDVDEAETNTPKRKRRKAAGEADEDCEDIKKPRRGRKKAVAQGASIINLFSKINDEAKETGASDQSAVAPEDMVSREEHARAIKSQPQVAAAENHDEVNPESVKIEEKSKDIKDAPPKKMLQLNRKAGTIGSPPKPKEPKPLKQLEQTNDSIEDKKKPSKGKRRPTRIVKINYSTDDAFRIRLGTMIDQILGDTVSPKAKWKTRMRTPREPKKAPETSDKMVEEVPQKDTHPFFTGRAKTAATTASTSTVGPTTAQAVKTKSGPTSTRPRIFSSTPCSPRKNRAAAANLPLPQFGVRSLGLKTPGARLPAWPPKDMVHVRGDGDAFLPLRVPAAQLTARKSKGNTIHITSEEMVLKDFAFKLQITETVEAVRNIDTEAFLPPPAALRLPQKHFESCAQLEQRVLGEVRNAKHPALALLRISLVSSLSAFDKYQCESISWAQKYTPKAAVEVLQHGKDPFLLRDWLQALKVQSVDTGEAKPKPVKPPKKKRKKSKLDDFIVDSDEEADEMDEVSDPEEDWSPDRRGVKRTVIRTGDILARDAKTPTRLTNTVVISGPHGCGKTSAVYAVAKELDFEVFEINPGSRRSGKDILEKIGDMTRNHLVQHHQNDAPVAVIDEEEVAGDIKSGKQATMNSFFKLKAASQPGRPKKQEVSGPVKSETKKLSSKNQKQSLILLDEVDILYEEDKQFWTTVISLIAQSKRPFIMTCNDENLVPLQALSLHGIFRFSAPPADLAIDRLLMIAACEGHALRRSAVEALYQARLQDLRACLTDLNYWCQIAVGDQRGGLDWFYPRWPKGCDIDEDGNVIRVISQDTYVEGMGWLAHDVVTQDADEARSEEELLHEARDFWHMDMGNWHDSLNLTSWAAKLDVNSPDRFTTLDRYGDFTEAMSIADLSSATAFATSTQEPIDCTLPAITGRARDDYILGRQLLDAPVPSTFDPLAAALPITMKCLARKNLQASTSEPSSLKLDAVNEASVIFKIQQYGTVSSEAAPLTRDDFSIAFDVLAASEKGTNSAASNLDASVFDGTMCNIALDVAPYVRSIVNFEKGLQKQRQKLSRLMSQGGTKRMRNTRASHAALEGGSRSTTRRDKWFNSALNDVLVMRTAGEGWPNAVKIEGPDSETGSGGSANSVSGSKATKGRARKVVTDQCDDEVTGSSSGTDVD